MGIVGIVSYGTYGSVSHCPLSIPSFDCGGANTRVELPTPYCTVAVPCLDSTDCTVLIREMVRFPTSQLPVISYFRTQR